ncbi:hypothetical protein AB0D49_14140 [Streptomyces sp. NPDC048290]|uniref:hypothetical protein n=1 Tax=Streptomyces sp. NPDC048290 TaxID=3155811 RepID=UPI00341D5B64
MSRSQVARRIEELLLARRALRAEVLSQITWWGEVNTRLTELEQAVLALRRHEDASAEILAQTEDLGVQDLQVRIAGLSEQYQHTSARFARTTVTLGVSGQARVGKSTVLRSISGLGAEQIPSGSGVPVTAVRSRIQHTEGPARAVLELHDPASFLEQSVWPYHTLLGLHGRPGTLDEFADWPYPDTVEDIRGPVLERVRAAQRALPSYRADLVGGVREVPLDQVRRHVAYPTQAEVDTGDAPRPYLAVKEVRISCPFPHGDVGQLALVDLPGLGEIAADAERHHVAGLRHEVDLVLLVKRPVEGMAFYSAADDRALALLDMARGLVRRTGDFVCFLVNRGAGDAPRLIEDLRGNLRSELNAGRGDSRFTVLEADGADPDAVGRDLLQPLLDLLVRRLPAMDRDIVAELDRRSGELAAAVLERVERITGAVHRLRGMSAAPAEDLGDMTRQLQESLAADLAALRGRLRAEVMAEQEDKDFVAAVESAYDQLRAWIVHGLGTGAPPDPAPGPAGKSAAAPVPAREGGTRPVPAGENATPPVPAREGGTRPVPAGENATPPIPAREDGTPPVPARESAVPPLPTGNSGDPVGAHRGAWVDAHLGRVLVKQDASQVAVDEFNRIRVEIGRRFSTIDLYFQERVVRLLGAIATTLRERTGNLLGDVPGTGPAPAPAAPETTPAPAPAPPPAAVLRAFADLLLTGSEPCPELAAAVGELLDLRLDYRTQLHPRIRPQLDDLSLTVRDPLTGGMRTQITVEASADGVAELYGFVQQRAEQAAHTTRQALLGDAVLPAQVLFAAVEQFEDALIRSGSSDREFARLARSYRNELWPGRYSGLGSGHARFAAVSRACDAVRQTVRQATGPLSAEAPEEQP